MANVRANAQMPNLSIKDRLAVRRLLAVQARQGVVARILNSKLMRWRYGAVGTGKLALAPPDLRTADASLVTEYRQGHFGLAGTPVDLNELSPFDVVAPNLEWQRALHGFGWLNHFAASNDADTPELARALVVDWIKHNHPKSTPCWQPDVLGRRLVSWLSHSNLLLGDADAKTYDLITRSTASQIVRLSATWRRAPKGMPKLQALTCLLLANLSITGHERERRRIENSFLDELSHQVLEDGGHVSRDATVLVELMLDLLPLEKCFAACDVEEPRAIGEARKSIFAFLQIMRLGDGDLARFNGVGVPEGANLARVLAYDDAEHPRLHGGMVEQSGYARLSNGGTVVIADVGAVADLQYATHSQAGCLSFEMSIGQKAIFVNGGLPGSAHGDWLSAARATASHNTLCLGETSSARMVNHAKLQGMIGGVPITEPSAVKCELSNQLGAQGLNAFHNGYLQRFGILHHRELTLSPDGRRLAGVDRLAPPDGDLRLKQDVPFAIHFHLHPDLDVRRTKNRARLEIVTRDGSVVSFACEHAVATVEESLYFADSSGPREALQIVLRGATFGESLVNWTISRE